jgi:glycosyltransferase involved in cell wall biosynthesis
MQRHSQLQGTYVNQTEASPLVSILVPLYNHARYVGRCLDSVLEDGYPRVEIVIIDDGSQDESAALARRWYEGVDARRIKRFDLESRPNRGMIRTLNQLIAKARGDYLVLLASDDYLLPGGIAARLEYLRMHPHKFAVFGDCIVVDDCGTTTHDSGIVDLYGGHLECLMNDDLLALELIYNWCVPGPGFMARRELYGRVGLYDDSLTVEDWDMYLRVAAPGLLGFIPGPVAAYRYHGGNSVLNERMRAAQLDSLMRTAWKNNRAFQGLNRLGLLYKYFKMRQDTAAEQGRTIKGYINRRISKLLYRLSVQRYLKVIEDLGSR